MGVPPARVTVVLPVFNGMPYLSDAVESIFAQTLAELRLLVINDGSTDDSRRYLDGLKDARVSVVHGENRGLGNALNRGIAMCATEYLARMDADDVAHRGRLATQLRFMDSHPEAVMVGTQVEFLAGGKVVKGTPTPCDHRRIHRMLLRARPGLCHPSLLMRTGAARAAGGYRIGGAGEDLDFCLRMCELGKVANVSEVLYRYRLHRSSLATTQLEEVRRGYEFALKCARARLDGRAEPSFPEFCSAWGERGWVRKAMGRIEDWSIVQYRGGLIDLAAGARGLGLVRLASASACRPGLTVRHLTTRLRHRLDRRGERRS